MRAALGSSAMRAFGLAFLFVVGAVVGLFVGVLAAFASIVTGRRAVHAHGVLCRAELRALDVVVGPRLAGPAVVRLGGALHADDAHGRDVLGMAIRTRPRNAAHDLDLRRGDQDLLLGTFESFHTMARALARTDVHDFCANEYGSVAPWHVAGIGVVKLRALPPAKPESGRAADRLSRLDADIESGRARFTLVTEDARGNRRPIAELHLLERLTIQDSALRTSMFRNGRGLRPVGFRNGIRALVYPLAQTGRRVRGG